MQKMDRLQKICLGIAGIGLADSLYLTWIKLTHTEAACIKGVGDCFTVNTSKFAEWNGIPIALLGFAAYLGIVILLLAETRVEWIRSISTYALFGISFIGVLYSAYLTYLEIAVLKAICPYCLLSAIAILSVFIIAVARLVKDQSMKDNEEE
jgi:uncharacterized membrane protein